MSAERKLEGRNREVLLAAGREAAERMIEREFDRVEATVQKDLAGYPALQRKLSEEITRIDEDYERSAEVPPEPPGWTKAVEHHERTKPRRRLRRRGESMASRTHPRRFRVLKWRSRAGGDRLLRPRDVNTGDRDGSHTDSFTRK